MTQSNSNLQATANEFERQQQEFLRSKPVVGQSVFMVKSHRSGDPTTMVTTVEKVGTKYFTLSEVYRTKFHIGAKTVASDFHSGVRLYHSRACYEHKTMKSKLESDIRNSINYGATCALRGLVIEDLTIIADILLRKKAGKN